jgi:Outer membrane protein beta-barrel domain
MLLTRCVVTIGALLLAAPPLVAQMRHMPSTQTGSAAPTVFVFGDAGGYSPISNLNDAGTTSFDTGYDLGGGAGLRLSRNVGVRASLDFARSKLSGDIGSTQDVHLNRFFYGGDLQLRYPFGSGVAPYAFGGAGAITLDPRGVPDADNVTKPAGHFGLGLSYDVPRSGLGLFTEGSGLLYKFDSTGFDRTQFDVAWRGGLMYRLHV